MFDRSTDTQSMMGSASSGLTEYDHLRKTVLIIDDERNLSELIKQYLSSLGYNVLTAEDGVRGLDIYEQSNMMIDLVMLDLNLPFMTGEEVFNKLIDIRPDVKIVISSGSAKEEVSGDVIENACCILEKPYYMADLASALRNVLDA